MPAGSTELSNMIISEVKSSEVELEELLLAWGELFACVLPQWLSREALYHQSDGIEPDNTSPPKPPIASWARREALSGARKPLAGRF
jgi:hypothetical protein